MSTLLEIFDGTAGDPDYGDLHKPVVEIVVTGILQFIETGEFPSPPASNDLADEPEAVTAGEPSPPLDQRMYFVSGILSLDSAARIALAKFIATYGPEDRDNI